MYTLPSDQYKEDDFVVKLYTCPVPFPFTFAVHAYVVFQHGNDVVRYDVNPIPFSDTQSKPFGHIQKDILPPETGFRWLGKYPFNFGPRYKVRLVGKISGDATSSAGRLYTFVASGGLINYPHTHTYRMILGPNSNTFIQWVLRQVPDSGLRLPSNAWGKNFKY